jgi:hypothetical protein
MSSNNRFALLVFAASLSGAASAATALEVCPVRQEQPLRFVDVFDGTPEQLATLVPDRAGERSGYWTLGYVYDAGRNVTIRCKYADGGFEDVILNQRVKRCSYRIDARKTLKVLCK